LDFTDRLLPRLQINPNNQPKLINFTPYTRNEIIDIVKDRLKDIGGAGIIDDRALFWCASKIASTSGDIRKMLDICRRASFFLIFKILLLKTRFMKDFLKYVKNI
jgi:cell division control protein 6